MKIGAYPFVVSGNMERNFQIMGQAIAQAAEQGVRLLVFPECALTGYPPRDIARSADVDFEKVNGFFGEFQQRSAQHDMYILVGAITEKDGKYYNSAVVFAPDGGRWVYNKRGLWGWDRENFRAGDHGGVISVDGLKIGLRICYEVRFPEYFRELYRENTNLNVILFYDVSDSEDLQRYELIKAHIRTRAMENVCATLSVNTIGPHQLSPTGLYDMSGGIVWEAERNREGLVVSEFHISKMNYSERGRKEITNDLLKRNC